MLRSLFTWGHAQPRLSLNALRRADTYPILHANELIALLGQENRLRTIRRLASLDHNTFNLLYQPALDAYIESVQLQPASTVDHHAGLGGLIVHTLEVVELAMRERKRYLLPLSSGPEVIAREEHCWTYGTFAAALLHDAGKLLTLTRLKLDTDRYWTPVGPDIFSTGASTYTIEFINAPYALQTRVSSMLFSLIPPVGRDLLAQNTGVLGQLTAWLNGDSYEWGILGKMTRQADSLSVAMNLRSGPSARLPNARAIPLAERLTRALRSVIHEGEVKFNRPGAAGWVDEHYAYLVCVVIANTVRARLAEEGSRDIPTDNTRLFDLWQDHGYLIPTPEGKAVWTMCFKGDHFAYTLTVLKFDASRVIHPSRRIAPFNGTITVADDALDTDEQTLFDDDNRPVDEAETNRADAPPASDTGPARRDANKQATAAGVPDNPLDAFLQRKAEQETREAKAKFDTAAKDPDKAVRDAVEHASQTRNRIYGPAVSLDDEGVSFYFMSWLHAGVTSGRFKVNEQKAFVHTLAEGVALVTPKVFHRFIVDTKLIRSEALDELHQATKRIQNQLRKKHLVHTTESGFSVFTVQVKTHSTNATLHAFLMEPGDVFGDTTPPPPNPILNLMSKKKSI